MDAQSDVDGGDHGLDARELTKHEIRKRLEAAVWEPPLPGNALDAPSLPGGVVVAASMGPEWWMMVSRCPWMFKLSTVSCTGLVDEETDAPLSVRRGVRDRTPTTHYGPEEKKKKKTKKRKSHKRWTKKPKVADRARSPALGCARAFNQSVQYAVPVDETADSSEEDISSQSGDETYTSSEEEIGSQTMQDEFPADDTGESLDADLFSDVDAVSDGFIDQAALEDWLAVAQVGAD